VNTAPVEDEPAIDQHHDQYLDAPLKGVSSKFAQKNLCAKDVLIMNKMFSKFS